MSSSVNFKSKADKLRNSSKNCVPYPKNFITVGFIFLLESYALGFGCIYCQSPLIASFFKDFH